MAVLFVAADKALFIANGTPGSKVQKLMLENIRGLMVKAELRRLRIENLNLKNRLRFTRRENAVLRQELGRDVSSSQPEK